VLQLFETLEQRSINQSFQRAQIAQQHRGGVGLRLPKGFKIPTARSLTSNSKSNNCSRSSISPGRHGPCNADFSPGFLAFGTASP